MNGFIMLVGLVAASPADYDRDAEAALALALARKTVKPSQSPPQRKTAAAWRAMTFENAYNTAKKSGGALVCFSGCVARPLTSRSPPPAVAWHRAESPNFKVGILTAWSIDNSWRMKWLGPNATDEEIDQALDSLAAKVAPATAPVAAPVAAPPTTPKPIQTITMKPAIRWVAHSFSDCPNGNCQRSRR